MIEIYKHDKSLLIPSGAYALYASNGWKKSNKDSEDANSTVAQLDLKDSNLETVGSSGDAYTFEESSEELDDENDEDVEYVDPKDLEEKPLEDLAYDELRILAEYRGLDVKKLKSTKALREALKGD